jgi:hypothetical protein
MTARVLVVSAAGWLSLYLLVYVGAVRAQGGEVAGWYVGLDVLAVVACAAAAAGRAPRGVTVAALVLTATAAATGLLSTGLLLVPAVLALALALTRPSGAAPGSGGEKAS